jgi:hypothetical protein
VRSTLPQLQQPEGQLIRRVVRVANVAASLNRLQQPEGRIVGTAHYAGDIGDAPGAAIRGQEFQNFQRPGH